MRQYFRSVLFSCLVLGLSLAAFLPGVLVGADAALAQNGTTDSSTSLLPQVYVDGLTATVSNTTLTGSFAIDNKGNNAAGGLKYELLVLGELQAAGDNELQADNAPVYFRAESDEELGVGGKTRETVEFSHTIPQLPGGTYRLRIQLATSNDRELGWDTFPLTVTGEVGQFAVITAGQVEVESYDPLVPETKRSTWSPLEGVNVDPGASVTLRAFAQNAGSGRAAFVPTLTTHQLLKDESASTQTFDLVNLPAGAGNTPVVLPITAPNTPGVYALHLKLNDAAGTSASSEAEFRLVVRGASASVISAAFDTPAYRQGEVAGISFAVVGPADRETTVEGTVEISVLDGDTPIGITSAQSTFGLAATSGTANVELTQDVSDMLGLKVVLKDGAGMVLDDYSVSFPTLRPEADQESGATVPYAVDGNNTAMTIGIIALIVIGLGVFVWLWLRQRQSGATPPMVPPAATMWLVIAGMGLLVWHMHSVQASGIQFKECPTAATQATCGLYDLWVNSPSPDEGVTPGAFEYEARMTWHACLNGVSGGVVSVYALTPGGEVERRVNTDIAQASDGVGRSVSFSGINVNPFQVSVPADQLTATSTSLPNWEFLARSRSSFRVTQDSGGGFAQDYHTFHGILNTASLAGRTTLWTEALSIRDAQAAPGGQSAQVRNSVIIDDFTPINLPQNTVTIDPNVTAAAQGFCPANSPTVAVLSQQELGARYNHTGDAGRYRVEIVSPTGLSDEAYRAFTWGNWPDDSRARHHGGAVFVMKNSLPQFVPDTDTVTGSQGGERVGNSDIGFASFHLDPPYSNSRTQTAGLARNAFEHINLQTGDFLTFSVNAIRGLSPLAQGTFVQNVGAVQLRICPDLEPVCSDGIDNDGDGETDAADVGCSSDNDSDETDPVCADTDDNDGDGKIDCSDPGCWVDANDPNTCDPNGVSEDDTECSDGVENDGDGLVDCSDPGCWTEKDTPDSCDANLNDESHIPGFSLPGFNEVE